MHAPRAFSSHCRPRGSSFQTPERTSDLLHRGFTLRSRRGTAATTCSTSGLGAPIGGLFSLQLLLPAKRQIYGKVWVWRRKQENKILALLRKTPFYFILQLLRTISSRPREDSMVLND